MNYYVRTQQVLAANAAQTQQRLAGMHALRLGRGLRGRGLRGMGQNTPGLPAGSQLLYVATWNLNPITQPQAINTTGILSDISSVLNNTWGIKVRGSGQTGVTAGIGGKASLSLTVTTGTDYSGPSDVQQIIDGVISDDIGIMPMSQIGILNMAALTSTSPPPPAGAQMTIDPTTGLPVYSAAPSFDIRTFLTTNWPWLVGGGVALLLLKDVL